MINTSVKSSQQLTLVDFILRYIRIKENVFDETNIHNIGYI